MKSYCPGNILNIVVINGYRDVIGSLKRKKHDNYENVKIVTVFPMFQRLVFHESDFD